MTLYVKTYSTEHQTVQVGQLKWTNSWLFVVDAPKGSIVCGSFDVDALNKFGLPAAQMIPPPDNPAKTIEEFLERNITRVNTLVSKLGVKPGMSIKEAIEYLL